MKKASIICVVILSIQLTACASSGVKIDPEKLNRFEVGKTTYAEVIQQFGKPTQRIVTDQGTTIIYSYFSAQARPESFIPIVGAFAGGADTENTMVSLTFDKRGILSRTTGMDGGIGIGHNLEGLSQDRKPVREVE